jgi:hypothetical protein
MEPRLIFPRVVFFLFKPSPQEKSADKKLQLSLYEVHLSENSPLVKVCLNKLSCASFTPVEMPKVKSILTLCRRYMA